MTVARDKKEQKVQQNISGLVVEYEYEGWSSQRAIELAVRDLGVSTEHAARAMNLKNGRKSLASETSDNGTESGVHLVAETESADSAYDRGAISELVFQLLKKLDEREQYILVRRYFGEKKVSLEQLSEELGLSRTWVTQLEKEALRYWRSSCVKWVWNWGIFYELFTA